MKYRPTLNLLGMNMAFEILQVETWTKVEGKQKILIILLIVLKTQIKEAIKGNQKKI
jgi:hypothetical protein